MVNRIRQTLPELVIHHHLKALGPAHQQIAADRVRPREVQVPRDCIDLDKPSVTRPELLARDAPPVALYITDLGGISIAWRS